jgi:hypothetical protein
MLLIQKELKLIDPTIESDMGEELDCDDKDEISTWALDAVEYLSKHNIIVDDENNEMNPDDNVRIDDSNSITDNCSSLSAVIIMLYLPVVLFLYKSHDQISYLLDSSEHVAI